MSAVPGVDGRTSSIDRRSVSVALASADSPAFGTIGRQAEPVSSQQRSPSDVGSAGVPFHGSDSNGEADGNSAGVPFHGSDSNGEADGDAMGSFRRGPAVPTDDADRPDCCPTCI